MRALVTDGQSSRWKVAEVPPPDIGPHEVLVEVAAAGLNHADLLMRQGRYLPTSADWNVPANRVGFEMAGRVRAVGPDVRGIAPGQFVMAQTGGACAELVAVDHQLLLPVPESVAATDAAGLPSALLTEYDALTSRARIRPADRVLITGATSGVGLVGVQLARALGAGTVIATTRSAAKADLLRSLGADNVIDTSTTGVMEALGPDAYDVCLDHVGGAPFAELMGAAAPLARIVQIGRLAGDRAEIDLELLAARRLRLIGTTFRGRDAPELCALVAHLGAALPGLLGEYHVRPVIDSVVDLATAEDAANRLTEPGLTGKVVLRIATP
ncbi:zinc-binding alcohol dehydrogenase family protein [Streptomyces niveus]|uniref:quinone oxidoreductase family protein n=1 Tax=Streptomyces niveus TaxID=193462 RepID=UPI00371CD7D3